MDEIIKTEYSLRVQNSVEISQDDICQKVIQGIREIEVFLSDFGFLSFGRNTILCGTYVFSLQKVLQSAELTVGSIISCCEAGCFADANTLLRKYRDDLFFYLYVVVYDTYDKLQLSEEAIKMQENIEQWIKDKLCDLCNGGVLKTIGLSPPLKDVVKQYKMQSSFDAIRDRLNNFVHGNGQSFYNEITSVHNTYNIHRIIKTIFTDMRIITMYFLFLLTICIPYSVSSTDYEDYLDCGKTPPAGCQYLPAPFIQDFFKKNMNVIDENCIAYLKEKTFIQFDE